VTAPPPGPAAILDAAPVTKPKPRCRGVGCRELRLDPILVDQPDGSGLHIGCIEPEPLPPPTPAGAAASPFRSPVGPPAPHPLKVELIEVVRWFDANSPRSLQTTIGPSEIGVACLRRLAYRTANTPAVNTGSDPWFAIIGTAVHDWLAGALDAYQTVVLGRTGTNRRWLIEQNVSLPSPGGDVLGHCDLYDVDAHRVTDHKIVGAASLKKYRDTGPSAQYRTQVHLYAYGLVQAGHRVAEVSIAYYPRSSWLSDLHVWAEPYDEQVAVDALTRLASVAQLAAALPMHLIPAAPDPVGCTWCDWYRPGRPADGTGCPGPLKGPER